MRMKLKKITCFMLAVCMFAMSQISLVFAAEQPVTKTTSQGSVDFEKGDASITIQGNDGQSLARKTWEIHRLFDVENSTDLESIQYTLNDTYTVCLQKVVAKKLNKAAEVVTEYEIIDYIQSLNEHVVEGAQTEQELEGSYSSYRYFVEEVVAQINADGITGDTVNVVDTTIANRVILKGLPYGYYVIEDVTDVQDAHAAASLCIVTTSNPVATMNVKSDYPTVVKKIQEDDNNVGWNDIADVEIGQLVPYKYESELPDMNGYHTYYYAWHDVMDEALTLQEDSIEITISGDVFDTAKTYQLTSSEFKLVTNTGNDDTFQIQIKDIKSIVDREFPQFNTLSENEYGQLVTVTYNALLNEKAASNTGRPGFENDVRLEFSNNPNSTGVGQTGFTPWDTVVCFTYRIDGVKVNNNGKTLADAKFKLYYDEACTKEVFVKKVGDTYCLIHTDSANKENAIDAVEICSDKNGKFTIAGLDGGTYYLLETEAPAGYRPILDPMKMNVTPSFTNERDAYVKGEGASDEIMKLSADATITLFIDGNYEVETAALTTDSAEGSVAISVVNEVGKKLPVTGSYLMPILFVIGSGCIVASCKKNKKYE